MTTTAEAIREIRQYLADKSKLAPRLRDALERLLEAVEIPITKARGTDHLTPQHVKTRDFLGAFEFGRSKTAPEARRDLVKRLRAVAEHDWRHSILAHTPDTAAEAATALEQVLAAVEAKRTAGYSSVAEGYAASLRQQARWIREALDEATPSDQRIDIDDIDVDELDGAADALEAANGAVEEAEKVMEELARISRSVTTDLCSAHDARRHDASQSMREDDTDLRHDFHNVGRAAAEWQRKHGRHER